MAHISSTPPPPGDGDAGAPRGPEGLAGAVRNGKKAAQPPRPGMKVGTTVKFRLYIAGASPNSMEAEFNLRSFCQAHLPGRHEIEIVDVLTKPHWALADGVTLTPMLVKVSPAPVFKIVGRMNSFAILFEALKMVRDKKSNT